MTFGSPTYIALDMPSLVADYARGLRERRERYDADLAPLPAEILQRLKRGETFTTKFGKLQLLKDYGKEIEHSRSATQI